MGKALIEKPFCMILLIKIFIHPTFVGLEIFFTHKPVHSPPAQSTDHLLPVLRQSRLGQKGDYT